MVGGGEGSSGTLLKRVAVGVVFVPLILYLVHLGGAAFLGFVIAVILLGIRELQAMTRDSGVELYSVTGFGLGIAVAVWAYSSGPSGWSAVPFILLIAVLARGLIGSREVSSFRRMAITLFALFYVAWTASHLLLLARLPEAAPGVPGEGAAFVYLTLVLTWSYDTGAYAVGTAFGRRKLAAALSPNKSLEGLLGGVGASVLACLLMRLAGLVGFGLAHALELGLLVGAASTLGDLVESYIKRTFGRKDSSTLIPGHGGVLDRFDSLLFSAPAVYYFLLLVYAGTTRGAAG